MIALRDREIEYSKIKPFFGDITPFLAFHIPYHHNHGRSQKDIAPAAEA